MSRETYNYKRQAIKAATELFYPNAIIEALKSATSDTEIEFIMRKAREEK